MFICHKNCILALVCLLMFCVEVFANNPINTIQPSDLYQKIKQKEVIVIDVRETDEFKSEHIEGAISIPLSILDSKQIQQFSLPIVLQCKSGMRGAKAYQKLKQENPSIKVYNLEGGIEAWKSAGLQTIKTHYFPQQRQVHIVAGTLTAIGTLLGVTLHPLFFIIPGFIGCGLAFSGITGYCGLGKLIALLPWNR